MKIKISDIENKKDKTEIIGFCEIYEEFNPQEPVKADIKIELQSSLVKVTCKFHAKVKLTCDYCLEEFTKEITGETQEYYERTSINSNGGKEFEIKENNFVQDLNGSDEIDITDLVYQILTLHIPNRNVCGINCKGKENLNKYMNREIPDSRLEIFKTIQTERNKE